MKLGLLLGAFLLATCFLAIWLFANWLEWSMADFVCQKGYWECRQDLVWPMALRVALSILAWAVLGFFVARQWKRR
jgi:uncharacterized membrane protein